MEFSILKVNAFIAFVKPYVSHWVTANVNRNCHTIICNWIRLSDMIPKISSVFWAFQYFFTGNTEDSECFTNLH